jgi:hypothetical protein
MKNSMIKTVGTTGNLLFFLSLIIWSASATLFVDSSISSVLGLKKSIIVFGIKIFYIFLMSLKIIFYTRYSKRQFCYIAIAFIIFFISYLKSTDDTLLIGFILVIGAKNIDLEKVMKYIFVTQIISCATIILLSLIGMIDNIYINSSYSFSSSTIIRNSYGFSHPNTLAAKIFQICLLWCVINYKKFRLKDYIIISIAAILVEKICYSRTITILIILMILLIFVVKLIEKGHINKLIKVFKYTLILAIITSIYFTINYSESNNLMVMINGYLSNRIYFANVLLDRYGFSIFGQNIELISSIEAARLNVSRSILDIAYMHLLIRYGIFSSIIFLGLYYKLIKKSIVERNYNILIALVIYVISGLAEKHIFIISANFTIFYIANILYEKGKARADNMSVIFE